MSENKKNISSVTIIFSVVTLVIGFTLGLFYQKSKTPSFSANGQFQKGELANNGQGMGRGTGNGNNDSTKNRGQTAGFRQTVGEVISIDDKSMTVKMTDGSSKIVLFSDSTSINQSTTAAKSDLKVGVKVAVMGDTNSDGSVTSKNIEINPHLATVTPSAQQ